MRALFCSECTLAKTGLAHVTGLADHNPDDDEVDVECSTGYVQDADGQNDAVKYKCPVGNVDGKFTPVTAGTAITCFAGNISKAFSCFTITDTENV